MTKLALYSRGWPFGWTRFDSLFDYGFNDVPEYQVDEKSATLLFDLPGFKQSEVTIENEGRDITVRAKNGRRSVSQSITVGREFDTAKAEARLENGVLTVAIPRGSESAARRIEIRSS